jgi:Uma2 family endonuclease
MATMTANTPRQHRFTAEQYFQMGETGVLARDARVELIDGEIVDMAPIGSPHEATIERLDDLLAEALRGRAMVRVQHSIVLDEHSVPEPDIAIVALRTDYYEHAHPRARDVLLLIEVADTTLAFDRDVKSRLYARSGVPEYWIVDIGGRAVMRLHSPRHGVYTASDTARVGDSISPGAFPDVRIEVRAILPAGPR